jgi:hypothetical protein
MVTFRHGKARIGTFADAAGFGEIVLDCTNGSNSIAALRQAGPANLRGKILIHVGNPLDTSKGMPRAISASASAGKGSKTVLKRYPFARTVSSL